MLLKKVSIRCSPGLEALLQRECALLGVTSTLVKSGRLEAARVSARQLFDLNVRSRLAERIVVEDVCSFRATSFAELGLALKRLRSEVLDRWLSPRCLLDVRVKVAHGCKLYHTAAVGERALAALQDDREDDEEPARDEASSDGRERRERLERPRQRLYLTGKSDRFTVSIDSSGVPLSDRGWRLAAAKMPLKATHAAAVLLAGGWRDGRESTGDSRDSLESTGRESSDGRDGLESTGRGESSDGRESTGGRESVGRGRESNPGVVVDPFCGSGTIPIEAASMLLGLPPHASSTRRFAFEDWPRVLGRGGFARSWRLAKNKANADAEAAAGKEAGVVAFGSDRDAGAVEGAKKNAERAGVARFCSFQLAAVSDLRNPRANGSGAGLIATNPPWGLRSSKSAQQAPSKASARAELRNLYQRFGSVVDREFKGWAQSLLVADLRLVAKKSPRTITEISIGGKKTFLVSTAAKKTR